MSVRTAVTIASMLMLCACKPQGPEHPAGPPTPNAAVAMDDATAAKPALTSHLDSAGRRTRYAAYLENSQLTRIVETPEGSGPTAEYAYRGARLHTYSQAATTGEGTVLELDDTGRVMKARTAGHDLAQTDIEGIRTRAQTLRSHALAQLASKGHY